jgi:glycosyltransferase involved in cell wall biosynthesis
MPKITCITTTYNEGPLLLTAVHSVLNQSFSDFEYIIVDDGSAEETRKILSGLKDPRLKIIFQANAGLSAARNTGIDLATGDYICFLDADDLRPNWSFAAIAKAIDAAKPDLVLCPGYLRDLRDEIEDFYDAQVFCQIKEILPQGISSRDLARHLQVCALAQQLEPQSANKVLRRDFLKSTGLRFPAPFFFEDIFFHTIAIAKSHRIAFLETPAFTYFRRYQKSQITATTGRMRFDIIAVVAKTLASFSLLPEVDDLTYRTVVLASCLKLMTWCETSIAHPLRADFHTFAQKMLGDMPSVFKTIRQDDFRNPSLQMPLDLYREMLEISLR